MSGSFAGRSKNVVSIVLIFASIASAVGCVMFFIEWVVTGFSNARYYVPPDQLMNVAGQAVIATIMIGLPSALTTGFLFALMVEFAGLHQIGFAIAASMLTLALAHLLPGFGGPIWRWESFWSLHVLGYLVVPTVVSWLVLRYWTGRLR